MIPATVAAITLSYVLGSVPTGLWLGLRFRGVDIREYGSKNIGATNTFRALGKALGAAALVGDMAKGTIAVLAVAQLSDWEYAPLVCGLASICGHTWSVFLKFKGGKGVATSAGVFFALAPYPMAVAITVFGLVVGTTKIVSAASILAALAFAICVFIFPTDPVAQAIGVLVAAIIVFRHRTNIARLLKGEEPKVTEPATQQEAGQSCRSTP